MAAAALPSNPIGSPSPYKSPYGGQPVGPTNNQPIAPNFNAPWTSGMSEAPVLGNLLNQTNYNTQPLSYLESYASNPGDSPWASSARTQGAENLVKAQSGAATQAATGAAQAEGNLAMNGGLTSGARERAQTNAQKNYLDMNQGLGATNLDNQLQISTNDAANKLQVAQALPGQETQAYQAELQPIQLYGQAYSQDVANAANAANAENTFNMGLFNTEGQMYGANQQANATSAAQQEADQHSGLFGMGGPLGLGGNGIGNTGFGLGANNPSVFGKVTSPWTMFG